MTEERKYKRVLLLSKIHTYWVSKTFLELFHLPKTTVCNTAFLLHFITKYDNLLSASGDALADDIE